MELNTNKLHPTTNDSDIRTLTAQREISFLKMNAGSTYLMSHACTAYTALSEIANFANTYTALSEAKQQVKCGKLMDGTVLHGLTIH